MSGEGSTSRSPVLLKASSCYEAAFVCPCCFLRGLALGFCLLRGWGVPSLSYLGALFENAGIDPCKSVLINICPCVEGQPLNATLSEANQEIQASMSSYIPTAASLSTSLTSNVQPKNKKKRKVWSVPPIAAW